MKKSTKAFIASTALTANKNYGRKANLFRKIVLIVASCFIGSSIHAYTVKIENIIERRFETRGERILVKVKLIACPDIKEEIPGKTTKKIWTGICCISSIEFATIAGYKKGKKAIFTPKSSCKSLTLKVDRSFGGNFVVNGNELEWKK